MSAPTNIVQTLREFEDDYVDDGYEFIGVGDRSGWRAIAGWGRDGWDLGDWPYVVYLFRDLPGRYERACYVEGDITIETFATADDREEATDESAAFYWRANPEACGLEDVFAAEKRGVPLPDYLRGPYRSRR